MAETQTNSLLPVPGAGERRAGPGDTKHIDVTFDVDKAADTQLKTPAAPPEVTPVVETAEPVKPAEPVEPAEPVKVKTPADDPGGHWSSKPVSSTAVDELRRLRDFFVDDKDPLDRAIEAENKKLVEQSDTYKAVEDGGSDFWYAMASNKPPADDIDMEKVVLDPNTPMGDAAFKGSRILAEHFWKPSVDDVLDPNIDKARLDDKDVAQFGIEMLGYANWNTMFAGFLFAQNEMGKLPPPVQIALAGMQDIYTNALPSFSWSGSKRMLKGMISDPSAWFGLASLHFVKGLLAGGSKTAASNLLRNAFLSKLLGSSFVGVEGAGYAVMYDFFMQKREHGANPGVPFKYNKARGLIAAGAGIGFGTGITMAVAHLPQAGQVVQKGARSVNKTYRKMVGDEGLSAGLSTKNVGLDADEIMSVISDHGTNVLETEFTATGVSAVKVVSKYGNDKKVRKNFRPGVTKDEVVAWLEDTAYRPKVKKDATLAEAQADTRKQADIVAERLNVLVPVETRIAGGGKYKPGQPNSGKPWSDLTETQLAEPGPGFKGTDNDLSKMLDDAISNSSAAAQEAARKTGIKVTLSSADFDKALKLPKSAQLWYELGGEGLRNKIPILKNDKLFSLVNDVLGVTSPLTKPLDNLKRTLATLSQHMRKEPMDVDIVNPAGVQEALARSASGKISAVASGNKTGNFSDTLSMVGGANVPPPIPVNDVWVGKLFGLTEEQLMNNQSLHEPMALFFNALRDHVNKTSGKALPHESWQIQSRTWVSERGAQDDYAQALSTIVSELRGSGIPGITKDGKITEQALKHPDFAAALRPTMEGFRKAAVATVEVGTKQTAAGREAAASVVELRKMKNNPQAVKLLDDYTGIHTSALYHATRGPGNMFDRVYQAVLGLPAGARITRISRPNKDRPFDVAGSFNGVFSPNVRIPLRDMSDDQVAIFNAIAGAGLRQDAMASSRIATVSSSAPVVKGKTRGLSVFIETAETIDGKIIQDFLKRLPKGFDISTDRVANGYLIDINPKFTNAGPKGITDKQLGPAFQMLHAKKLSPKRLRHDHSSVYNEASEFAALETKFRQELKDGVIKELGEKLGWTEARARRYIDGRGIGKATHAQRSRAKTARSRYQRRLGDLDAAAQASREVSESVNIGYTLWNEKARKVLPEHITSAAIRLPDGTIVEGTTHGVAINKAREGGLLNDWPEAGLNPWEFQDAGGHLDLFKTSSGRVIDRFEANKKFGISAAEDVKP